METFKRWPTNSSSGERKVKGKEEKVAGVYWLHKNGKSRYGKNILEHSGKW